MTSADLRRWQTEMGLSLTTASHALGINRATYARWLAGRPIPSMADLACAAMVEQLAPYSQREHNS